MRRIALAASLLILAFASFDAGGITATAQSSPFTFKAWTSPAPNRHTAAGGVAHTAYVTWAGRAMDSIENGKGNIGDPSADAAAFQIVHGIVPRLFAISSNTSWRTLLNPTGAFADQYGNAMHFPFHVKGNGTVRFKYEDISWCVLTPEAPNTVCNNMRLTRPHSSGAWDRVDCTYGWGYDWGADRQKGGGDDVKVCGGTQTERGNFDQTLVDELYFVGMPFAHAADHRYQNSAFPEYADYTLQEVFDDFCKRHNNNSLRKEYGMELSIVASDNNTYKFLVKRPNPEFGQKLQPGKCIPYPPEPQKRSKKAASPPATPKPQVYACEELQKQGYIISAAHGLRSGVQCQAVSAAGIGIAWVLEAGVLAAVDIWGYADQTVKVCFPSSLGQGGLLFLDAGAAPRSVSQLPSTLESGMVCGQTNGAGTLVMVASGAAPPQAESSDDGVTTLSGCMVTTTAVLNFRAAPAGEIMRTLPWPVTLTAVARVDGWFKVDYHGVQGWISADYATTSGTCG